MGEVIRVETPVLSLVETIFIKIRLYGFYGQLHIYPLITQRKVEQNSTEAQESHVGHNLYILPPVIYNLNVMNLLSEREE